MNNSRKIAVAQISPTSGDISHFLGKAMEYMGKAYMEGAALRIFPEMYLKRER
jgi:predicted amidohydrolase